MKSLSITETREVPGRAGRRYAVAEEIERGELEAFRIGKPLQRNLHVARLARRPLSPSERGFVETLTRCCAKSEAYAAGCVA